jgi:acyl-CoA reductase-like NAD-dependent aldehyde dehydrogenase
VPLDPVAVFDASNLPLAFSIAAAAPALAAGLPVLYQQPSSIQDRLQC